MAEKEYIERGALLERLKFKRDKSLDLDGRKRCGLDSAIAQVRKAPAADVVEVKHGEWFLLDECSNEGVYCSVCTKKVYRTEYANQKLKSNYCPNCGADMRGERKEK